VNIASFAGCRDFNERLGREEISKMADFGRNYVGQFSVEILLGNVDMTSENYR